MQSRLSSLRLPALRTFQSRPLSTSPPAAFPIPSSSRFSEASPQAAASPPLSEGEQALKNKLATNMEGAKIEVQDVSGGCGTFYAISISHSSFKGLSTIKQHRLVNEVLKDEIKGMHGMQLKTAAE